MATLPEILEDPPRSTGSLEQDYPLLVDWFYRALQVINQSIEYIKDVKSEDIDTNTTVSSANKAIFAAMVSGTVTVSNTETGATVTFDDTQKDASYVIILQGKSVTGAPAAGAYDIKTKTYSTASFTFTINASPGAGTSVTFEWQLIRIT